MNQAELWV